MFFIYIAKCHYINERLFEFVDRILFMSYARSLFEDPCLNEGHKSLKIVNSYMNAYLHYNPFINKN
jgi:hypothetical protein